MSLINQALRKAQHQRTPNRAATAADHAGGNPSHNHTVSTGRSGLLIGLIAGIAVLIGLVAGLSIVMLQTDPASAAGQTVPEPTAVTQTTQPEATEPLLWPLKQSHPAAPPPTASNSQDILTALHHARDAVEAKAAAVEQTISAAQPSQDVINWLTHATISGVRISKTNSKVILNNKTYSVGETVNFKLRLKVLIIQEKRALFIDHDGIKYFKVF